jgi:hypothetical protein
MSQTSKILGQVAPAANTLTALYTVPRSAIISTVRVCNRNAVADTVRISVAIAGAADATAQYVIDEVLPGLSSIGITEGWALNATDVIRCFSLNGTTSFNVFGVEIA